MTMVGLAFVVGVVNLSLGIGLLTMIPDYGYPENNRGYNFWGWASVLIGGACLVGSAIG